MASNSYQLTDVIMEHSESSVWEDAVQEWGIIDCSVDHTCSSRCVCGKENIKYLFTIQNGLNRSVLEPIGSKCIQKFGRQDLNEVVRVHEQMAKLVEAVKNKSFITFDSQLFSRNLLKYLYDNGCFSPTEYNRYNPRRDYQFLLDMFNKRNEPSQLQKRKVTALIMNSIIPFCKKTFREV